MDFLKKKKKFFFLGQKKKKIFFFLEIHKIILGRTCLDRVVRKSETNKIFFRPKYMCFLESFFCSATGSAMGLYAHWIVLNLHKTTSMTCSHHYTMFLCYFIQVIFIHICARGNIKDTPFGVFHIKFSLHLSSQSFSHGFSHWNWDPFASFKSSQNCFHNFLTLLQQGFIQVLYEIFIHRLGCVKN